MIQIKPRFRRTKPCETPLILVAPSPLAPYHRPMFTIEHEFDATVITLIDEGAAPLTEDVIVEAYEDCVVIEQLDTESETPLRITLSIRQVNDLAAALNLPEGIYRRK